MTEQDKKTLLAIFTELRRECGVYRYQLGFDEPTSTNMDKADKLLADIAVEGL